MKIKTMKIKTMVIVTLIVIGISILTGRDVKLPGSRWEISEAVTAEGTFSKEEVEELLGNMELVFVDDTTFIMVSSDKSMGGTYTVDGNKLLMILESGTQQEAEVKGKQLKLLSTNDSGELIMKKK